MKPSTKQNLNQCSLPSCFQPLGFLSVFFIFCISLPLPAQEVARLTVGTENVELELVEHTDAAIFKTTSKRNAEDTKDLYYLEVSLPTDQDQWQPLSLSFKVKEATEVTIQLGGARGNAENNVLIDKVEASPVNMQNGDFEEVTPRGPKNWKASNWGAELQHAVEDPEKAASGTHFVHVSRKSFLSQTIDVPKDTEITVSIQVRSFTD